MSEVIEKIQSKGHWDVGIRAQRFVDGRVPYGELESTLESAAVRLRGWPVPFIDHRVQPLRGEDWVGQDIDAQLVSHKEAWRFFTSGQFNHLRAVSADWRTGQEATSVPAGFESAIEVWEILFYLTEVFELAARLSLSAAGDDSMTISASLEGLGRRALVVGQHNRVDFHTPYGPPPPSIEQEVTLTREDLIAEPRAASARMASEFFQRFGWNPSLEQLKEHQTELAS